MNVGDFNKIVIVSLCDSYTKNLGNLLSQNLGMIFCDTKDLIEYELIDKNALKEFCTKEYLDKAEKSVLKHIASFENVVVSINYDYLTNNFNIIKEKSLIVYVDLPKTFIKANVDIVQSLAYDSRSKDLKKMSHAVVNVRKTEINFVCEKVMEKLGGIL